LDGLRLFDFLVALDASSAGLTLRYALLVATEATLAALNRVLQPNLKLGFRLLLPDDENLTFFEQKSQWVVR
jgi:hypothetical protein